MNNFKPSELPENTVIEVDYTQYIKQGRDYGNERSMIFWVPLPCEDCAGTASYTEKEADEALKDYEIISMPMTVVNKLALWLQDELEKADVHSLITEAVAEVNKEVSDD